MIGHPMDARGFTTLAGHFRDRTVVTYDPRGTGRSEVTDRTQVRTPELHADDLHRLISALNAGPVDIFASSGGAINALALVARHPEDVHTLVAHEPPVAPVLPDREQAEAAIKDIRKTYEREGFGPAMAKFIVFTSLKGPIPADFAAATGANPADFGLPTADDGSRDDPLLGASFIPITHYVPDFEALRAAPTRIVIAAGVESEGKMAHRAALAIAERLNQEAVIFPSHHGGFLGGEFGYRGDPDAFAATLRQVLAEEGVPRGPEYSAGVRRTVQRRPEDARIDDGKKPIDRLVTGGTIRAAGGRSRAARRVPALRGSRARARRPRRSQAYHETGDSAMKLLHPAKRSSPAVRLVLCSALALCSFVALAATARADGPYTHHVVAKDARDGGNTVSCGDLESWLSTYEGAFLSGAVYPDWGYLGGRGKDAEAATGRRSSRRSKTICAGRSRPDTTKKRRKR